MLTTDTAYLLSRIAPPDLRPLFSYYGSKWASVLAYGIPRYGTIVEPFAGSACYSSRFYDRKVVLVEKDPQIAAILKYLVRTPRQEILDLPLLEPGESVDDINVPPEARLFIGAWLTRGSSSPRKTMPDTRYARMKPLQYWGTEVRDRIANQVPYIKHWNVIEGNYSRARNRDATWFIDPPYEDAGKHYRHGSKGLDYDELADWCRSRRGQVIVCEQQGANWLPFEFLRMSRSNHGLNGPNGTKRGGKSAEVVWRNDGAA